MEHRQRNRYKCCSNVLKYRLYHKRHRKSEGKSAFKKIVVWASEREITEDLLWIHLIILVNVLSIKPMLSLYSGIKKSYIL